ncbi:uncharacterized protein [Panulirus ornatus]|uniref:uncharacterized protein isoform X2 n=1 Tax=Panulirus ornatus TaxID=150431 RepID=UPI003A8A6C40
MIMIKCNQWPKVFPHNGGSNLLWVLVSYTYNTKQNQNFSQIIGCDISVTGHENKLELSFSVYLSSASEMAERGKELSDEKKRTIVTLSDDGLSGRQIAKMLKINASTVHKFLKRYGERGYVENESRSGRPTKYDGKLDRQLLRVVENNRRKSLQKITNTFNEVASVTLSQRTVRRRLIFYGYTRRIVKKIIIPKANRSTRTLSTSNLHNNVHTSWNRVIFSDETQDKESVRNDPAKAAATSAEEENRGWMLYGQIPKQDPEEEVSVKDESLDLDVEVKEELDSF